MSLLCLTRLSISPAKPSDAGRHSTPSARSDHNGSGCVAVSAAVKVLSLAMYSRLGGARVVVACCRNGIVRQRPSMGTHPVTQGRLNTARGWAPKTVASTKTIQRTSTTVAVASRCRTNGRMISTPSFVIWDRSQHLNIHSTGSTTTVRTQAHALSTQKVTVAGLLKKNSRTIGGNVGGTSTPTTPGNGLVAWLP